MPSPIKLGSAKDHANDQRDLAILRRLEEGASQPEIAVEFGVSQAHVSNLKQCGEFPRSRFGPKPNPARRKTKP